MDLEGNAFYGNIVTPTGWRVPISGVSVNINQISSHQGEVQLSFPFLRYLKCEFRIKLFVTTLTEIPEDRKVHVYIEMNNFAKIHPKSALVLRSLGVHLEYAIFTPQRVYPEIPDEEKD